MQEARNEVCGRTLGRAGRPLARALRAALDRWVREADTLRPTMNPVLDDATIECLREALPAGTQVIVFGSDARGEARADSDLDLLVIEPEVADRAAETARLASLLGRRLVPADVVVMSRSAFERERALPNTLAHRAAREGRPLELSAARGSASPK